MTLVGEHGFDSCAGRWVATDRRDTMPEQGLYEKYEVTKNGEPVEDCFVLEPEDDSAAREALIRYAEVTDDEELAEELDEWVIDICTRGDSDGA